MKTWLVVIGSALTIAVGLLKYFRRKNAYRRKLAEEAKEKLENAQKEKNKSDLLDAWSNVDGGNS